MLQPRFVCRHCPADLLQAVARELFFGQTQQPELCQSLMMHCTVWHTVRLMQLFVVGTDTRVDAFEQFDSTASRHSSQHYMASVQCLL